MPFRVPCCVLVLATLSGGCAGTSVGRLSVDYETCADPASAAAYERALAAQARGERAAALDALSQVVTGCPDFVAAHMLYQDMARSEGGVARQRMEAFYRELEDRPASPVPPFLRARLAGSDKERLDELEVSLSRDRSFAYAHEAEAEIYSRVGQTDRALGALEMALDAKPDAARANLAMAELLVQLGRHPEARGYYENYFRLSPGDRNREKDYLGLLVYDLGSLETADAVAEGLLAFDPQDVEVLMDRAAILWKRGQGEEALDVYHQVLTIQPECERAVLNIGNLCYGPLAGDSDEGRRRWWPTARRAYLYYRNTVSPRGLMDQMESGMAIPYRLRRIEELLGPAANLNPSLSDF